MSQAALRGAEILGWTLHPHQLALADQLDNAEETVAICWPRRAGKTSTIWAWMIGKCDLNEDFSIITSAQTGTKAKDRYLSHARVIERKYPEELGGPKIKRGAGNLEMLFQNGSRLISIAPDPDNFRGDETDVIFIDESQALDPEKLADIKQACMALFDTVDDGRMVLAGTPGNRRSGWYWQALEAGRQGLPLHELSEYALKEFEDVDDEDNWLRVHPGIGTLTTLNKMRARRAGLPKHAWAQEYMGVWPPDLITRALPEHLWKATGCPPAALPDGQWVLGFDCAIDGSSASITAAWIDTQGVAHLQTMEHRQGTSWVATEIAAALKKHPRLPVVYDAIGSNVSVAQALQRMPRLNTNSVKNLTLREVAAGASLVASGINDGTLMHAESVSMDLAAEGAVWRNSGESRLFGRKSSTADISSLVAGSLALFVATGTKERGGNNYRKPVLL